MELSISSNFIHNTIVLGTLRVALFRFVPELEMHAHMGVNQVRHLGP